MEGLKLSFARRGIAAWEGIWLLPAGPQYDIVGGGITILERTIDILTNEVFIDEVRTAMMWNDVAHSVAHLEKVVTQFRPIILARALRGC